MGSRFWGQLGNPLKPARGFSSFLYALLLDFKNGIYQQTRTRTNLLLYSQDFSNAAWSLTAATAGSASLLAPDGSNTANKLTPTTATSAHQAVSTSVATGAGTYSASAYIKAAGYGFARVQFSTAGFTNSIYVDVNLATGATATGVTGSGAVSSSSASAASNGYYRVTVTGTIGATTTYFVVSAASALGTTSFAGDGTSGIQVWGAQLEAAPAASAYIPTTSAPVSVTESVTVNGAPNVNQLYGYTYSRSGAKEEVGTKPFRINYCTNYNASAASTNMTKSGDAAATLTYVNDAAALATAGLTAQVPTGTVYKLDNSAGVGPAYAIIGGAAPTAAIYSLSAYIRGGTGDLRSDAGDGQAGFAASANYVLRSTAITLTTAGRSATITASAGQVVYFILNQWELGSATAIIQTNGAIGIADPASSFAANVPAIIPGTGYFARPAYTNLVTYSQDFTNANWAAGGAVPVNRVSGSVAPDGSSTAIKLSVGPTVGSYEYSLGQNAGLVANTTYTFSVFMKVGDYNFGYLRLNSSTNSWQNCWFNLSNGTIGSNGVLSSTPTITAVGNGWYRCSITFTTGATVGSQIVDFGFASADGGASSSFASSSTGLGIYVWQAQVVQASDPGPIIVTTSATAAVGADALQQGLSPALVDQDMLIAIKFNLPSTAGIVGGQTAILGVSDGTGNNRLVMGAASNGTQWNLYLVSAGTSVRASAIAGSAIAVGTQVIALRRRAGKFTGAVVSTGGAVTIETEGGATAFPTGLNKLAPGSAFDNTNQFRGTVQSAIIRPGTFSDTDLTNILTAL